MWGEIKFVTKELPQGGKIKRPFHKEMLILDCCLLLKSKQITKKIGGNLPLFFTYRGFFFVRVHHKKKLPYSSWSWQLLCYSSKCVWPLIIKVL